MKRTPVKLLKTTGWRDQSTRTTMIPWSDEVLGLLGFNYIPDGGRSIIVYVYPAVDHGVYELRCHAALSEPDPDHDDLLARIQIPSDALE